MEKIDNLEKHEFNSKDTELTRRYGERYLAYRRFYKSGQNESLDKPIHLDIDFSDSCNLKCSMCHQNYRKRNGAQITLDKIEKAISECYPDLCCVNFGASAEPLLEPQMLFDALDIVKKYDVMDYFIHTNGILLTPEISSKLVDKELRTICISLDAASAEVYTKMRVPRGNGEYLYNKIIDNIDTLLNIRGKKIFPKIRLSFCECSLNSHEKDKFMKMWKNKIDIIDYQELHYVDGCSDDIKNNLKEINVRCDAGKIRGTLFPSGDIGPCCFAWEQLSFGNIMDMSIHEIWKSKKATYLRNTLSNGQISNYPTICKMCKGIQR